MSIGYGGRLILACQDGELAIYHYACGNINKGLNTYYTDIARLDGIIAVDKTCFVEPEIHRKIKKLPSGRKKPIEKRILVPVDYGTYIKDGRITIQNASACWRTIDGIDFMALRLLYELFDEYQEQGALPERISVFW